MKSTIGHPDTWTLGSVSFRSRLLLGSAGYPSRESLWQAIDAAQVEVVTVSLRRVRVQPGVDEDLYAQLRARRLKILPNTAGCFTADEAVKTAEMARQALDTNWIKLEVIADEVSLLPDTEELLKAAEQLVRRGFVVLPYTNDDPVAAKKLQDLGCAAVMPLAAPIGSGLGVRNPHNLELIVAQITVPVIVDAGLGTASDVALAIELGASAVLANTAVAQAHDPVRMARAMSWAALSGFDARMAGRMPRRYLGQSASQMDGRAWRP